MKPMRNTTLPLNTDATIWARIVDAEGGDLTRPAAETLLELDFRPADRKRMNKLAEKTSAGKLTAREREEAESFNRVAHVLALLQSKARRSLARNRKIH